MYLSMAWCDIVCQCLYPVLSPQKLLKQRAALLESGSAGALSLLNGSFHLNCHSWKVP